jgi:hypothetical protein
VEHMREHHGSRVGHGGGCAADPASLHHRPRHCSVLLS